MREKKILSVKIRTEIDTDYNFDYLGHYTDHLKAGEEEYAIDRVRNGDKRRHEYRYFVPASDPGSDWDGVSDEAVRRAWNALPEDVRDANPESTRTGRILVLGRYWNQRCYERCEALQRGEWHGVGIRAVAEVDLGSGVVQKIMSGGLWGIESDATEHIKNVSAEELANLKDELESLGFSEEEISEAFSNVE